jgi:hypothetical protein
MTRNGRVGSIPTGGIKTLYIKKFRAHRSAAEFFRPLLLRCGVTPFSTQVAAYRKSPVHFLRSVFCNTVEYTVTLQPRICETGAAFMEALQGSI